jgi:Protein of unknown function (DUF3684)
MTVLHNASSASAAAASITNYDSIREALATELNRSTTSTASATAAAAAPPPPVSSKASSQSSSLQRVEVNQRALIDKILARYATASAVYRELLQNSNDAGATMAEIHYTTTTTTTNTTSTTSTTTTAHSNSVSQVVYRNNGAIFAPTDWHRLQKIAEGNPDVNKVGAFGVGAYTMFSICEEPIVVSGSTILQFVWQGDALYTLQIPNTNPHIDEWTTFYLSSRDVYPLPDWNDFGQFLVAALTFTNALHTIRVTVNGEPVLTIQKSIVSSAQALSTRINSSSGSSTSTGTKAVSTVLTNSSKAAASFLWNALSSSSSSSSSSNASKITSSNSSSTATAVTRTKLFDLQTVYESVVSVTVQIYPAALTTAMSSRKSLKSRNNDTGTSASLAATTAPVPTAATVVPVATARIDARYVSATANTSSRLTPDMARRMERVTKKPPPPTVTLHVFLNDREPTARLEHCTTNNNTSSNHQASKESAQALALSIAQSWAPVPGQGRIFIGFRTSQTTGLGAHVAAPFVPTVEREAIDLQNTVLAVYNVDLLELAGLVLRLVLEHVMHNVVDPAWQTRRETLESAPLDESSQTNKSETTVAVTNGGSTASTGVANGVTGENDLHHPPTTTSSSSSSSSSTGLMSFAMYMARCVGSCFRRNACSTRYTFFTHNLNVSPVVLVI